MKSGVFGGRGQKGSIVIADGGAWSIHSPDAGDGQDLLRQSATQSLQLAEAMAPLLCGLSVAQKIPSTCGRTAKDILTTGNLLIR